MAYRVVAVPRAQRDLASVPPSSQRRVREALTALAAEPRPSNVRKLAGVSGQWRVRVGAYRVIFAIDDAAHVVTILAVGHRRDVYR